jgi:hypothetical protein
MKEKNAFSDLFESRPKNKKNKWGDELGRFRLEERLDMRQDPLLWWKLNEIKYPLLGTSIISLDYTMFLLIFTF